MTTGQLAVIVLAAGKGTRMKSERPKVMHPLAGQPMIGHVLAAVASLAPARTVVVVGPDMTEVSEAVAPATSVVQPTQRGTGDAVLAARQALDGFAGDILVVYGDTPLVGADTLSRMVERRRQSDDPALVVLGMRPTDPGQYGRLILEPDGRLAAIVEHADATPAQRAVGLCNAGLMAADGRWLFGLIERVGTANAKGEVYLTDAVAVARAAGLAAAVVEGDAEEVLGINSRAELAAAEAVMQRRLRQRAMAEGATLVDPSTVWLSADTRLGRDVVVHPCVVFGPGVLVEDSAEIRSFSHIEGAVVRSGATIGPHARLRPGTEVGAAARVGNFVEVKNARLAAGSKVNHLSYIGDAEVGSNANIGAGTITCNYDGYGKFRTEIGADAFIGSNTALVAPVSVGDRAIVGAGSVITRPVPADALAIARAPQEGREGWAAAFRKRRKAAREAAKAARD
jgi:bifunctional UDP-N-acetylglucosamine pyrophosphorylase/glucosamine-1-phosphate N-acetyltransferase